ncbi:MAG: hypothetical protein PVI40_05380 [Chlamydiota bacterium]|jgi:hypothetical protein
MIPTPFYVHPTSISTIKADPLPIRFVDPNNKKIHELTMTILKQHPEVPINSSFEVKQILINEEIDYKATSIDKLLPLVVKKIKHLHARKPEENLLFNVYKRLSMGTPVEKVYIQAKEYLHHFSEEEAISFIYDIQEQETTQLRNIVNTHLHLPPSRVLRHPTALRFSSRKKIQEFLAQMREDLIDELVLEVSSSKQKDLSSQVMTSELHKRIMDRFIKKDRDMHNITETIRKEALESAGTFLQQASYQDIEQLLSNDSSIKLIKTTLIYDKGSYKTALVKLLAKHAVSNIFKHLKSLSDEQLLKYFSPLEFFSVKNIRRAIYHVSKFFRKKSKTAKNNAYMNRYFHTWQSASIIIRSIQSNPDLSDAEIEKQLPPLKLIESEDRLSWIKNIRSTLKKFQAGSQGVFDSLFEASIERDLVSLLNKA